MSEETVYAVMRKDVAMRRVNLLLDRLVIVTDQNESLREAIKIADRQRDLAWKEIEALRFNTTIRRKKLEATIHSLGGELPEDDD